MGEEGRKDGGRQMSGEKILVVDDVATVRNIVYHHLAKDGFHVITAGDAYSAFELVRTQKPDLILLDIILPGLDGIEFCRELRKETNVPIIFLTSKSDCTDLIVGLGVGGDDYITKPFIPSELIARVKAHLRRNRVASFPKEQKKLFKYPGLEIDLTGHIVRVNGSPVDLSIKEFELLALLAQNPNRIFHNNQLLDSIWQSKDFTDNRTLMVHISRLRKKIEKDPSNPVYILNVRGIGYKFNGL